MLSPSHDTVDGVVDSRMQGRGETAVAMSISYFRTRQVELVYALSGDPNVDDLAGGVARTSGIYMRRLGAKLKALQRQCDQVRDGK